MQFWPKTRNQWIAAGAVAVGALVFLYFFTDFFRGHAVEVSFENASQNAVFVYIDNTGRHGDSTATERLKTTTGGETPLGLEIGPGATRSFGPAVGLGDMATLHISPINAARVVDTAHVHDCAMDTVSLKRIEVPSLHVKMKWSGPSCPNPAFDVTH